MTEATLNKDTLINEIALAITKYADYGLSNRRALADFNDTLYILGITPFWATDKDALNIIKEAISKKLIPTDNKSAEWLLNDLIKFQNNWLSKK